MVEEWGTKFCSADLFCDSSSPQILTQSLISKTKFLLLVFLLTLLMVMVVVLLQVAVGLFDMLIGNHLTRELLPQPPVSPRSQILEVHLQIFWAFLFSGGACLHFPYPLWGSLEQFQVVLFLRQHPSVSRPESSQVWLQVLPHLRSQDDPLPSPLFPLSPDLSLLSPPPYLFSR